MDIETTKRLADAYRRRSEFFEEVIRPKPESVGLFLDAVASSLFSDVTTLDNSQCYEVVDTLYSLLHSFTESVYENAYIGFNLDEFIDNHVYGECDWGDLNVSTEIWRCLDNWPDDILEDIKKSTGSFNHIEYSVNYDSSLVDNLEFLSSYIGADYSSYVRKNDATRVEENGEENLSVDTPAYQALLGENNEKANTVLDIDENVFNVYGSYPLPKLKLEPYYYQKYGMKHMLQCMFDKGFVLNADDVGLGKTLQTIGSILFCVQNCNLQKILIICKKSIKKQWVEEIKRFTDLSKDFYINYTSESKRKRTAVYEEARKAGKYIIVTNYHTCLNDTVELMSLGSKMFVLDEAHSVKNREGKINNAIASICRDGYMIFLTGTPIMSRIEDVYGILQICRPEYLGDWDKFAEDFLIMGMSNNGPYVKGYKNEKLLREKIQGILIRRTAKEVAIELPEINAKQITCDSDEVQANIMVWIAKYKRKLARIINNLKSKKVLKEEEKQELANAENTLKGLIAADQYASSDPRLFKLSRKKLMGETIGSMVPDNYKMSDKNEKTLAYIEQITDAGHKVIIFSKLKASAKLLIEDIKNNLKIEALPYTGDEDEAQRNVNVELFRTSKDYPIIVGTEAMAEGLNLQVARYVINYDQPDSSAIKTQRIGRARRSGSTHDTVMVYDMITSSAGICDYCADEETGEPIEIKTKDEERLMNIVDTQDLADQIVTLTPEQRKQLILEMENNMVSTEGTFLDENFSSISEKMGNTESAECLPGMKYSLTVQPDINSKSGTNIWVIKFKTRFNTQEYITAKNYLRSLGAYYSNYRKAFVFEKDPMELLAEHDVEVIKAQTNDIIATGSLFGISVTVSCTITPKNNKALWIIKADEQIKDFAQFSHKVKRIGGKWNGWRHGFEFWSNPIEYLDGATVDREVEQNLIEQSEEAGVIYGKIGDLPYHIECENKTRWILTLDNRISKEFIANPNQFHLALTVKLNNRNVHKYNTVIEVLQPLESSSKQSLIDYFAQYYIKYLAGNRFVYDGDPTQFLQGFSITRSNVPTIREFEDLIGKILQSGIQFTLSNGTVMFAKDPRTCLS